jgi:predicted histidine transporter YuiF (NhaC family)
VIATIVDWDAILQVIWVSLLAGVGVTAAWGFALLGATRALEFGRDGRAAAAVSYAVLGAAGVAIVLGAIVFGIVILTGD